jgi:hypothetical protein
MIFFCVSCFFNLSCSKKVVSSQVEVLQVLFKNFMFKKEDTIEAFDFKLQDFKLQAFVF